MQSPSGLVFLDGSQDHHQSFFNNLSWKEVSIAVIKHLEVVLPLWLWVMRDPSLSHLQRRLFDVSGTNTWKLIRFQHHGRKHFSNDIKPDEVHCKLQYYFYFLTCTQSGIQHVGKNITPLDLIMNIHRRVKSGLEILILIVIGMFAKIQHFQSKSLKRYQEMVTKLNKT